MTFDVRASSLELYGYIITQALIRDPYQTQMPISILKLMEGLERGCINPSAPRIELPLREALSGKLSLAVTIPIF
jgi:hypothetical protein